jgi:hypothetical protein|tara:strand:+ start:12872 stop:13927 length:1056 start_codon:yes stop_codon:yes gene_type:complete
LPLYLDDELIETFVYEEVAVALWAIHLHAEDVAVTPALALRLIRQYLQPLIPPGHWHVLNQKQPVTWNRIWMISSELASLLGQINDPMLFEIGIAIELIHSHTTLPPREYTFPTVIEVTYFLSMCGQLKIPVQSQTRLDREQRINPFNFCSLCWRQPLLGRKLCAHHSPGTPLMSEGADKRAAAARYKSGVRQKEQFDKAVNRILTKEVTEFHEGLFTPVVLFPEQDIAAWLTERRPSLWQLLGERQQEFNDGNAVGMLLDLLHSPNGLSSKAYQIYRQINRHLQEHPRLIWPMLIRAEGWHRCREEVRAQWGGKRTGAGRPVQPATEPPATSSCTDQQPDEDHGCAEHKS